jgi:hypothetical protein
MGTIALADAPAKSAASIADGVNPFETFWTLGFRRLVPIVPPGAPISERSTLFKRQGRLDPRGKAPGLCGRDGKWKGFDFVRREACEDDLDRWHAMGAGVGIKTGRGLVALDIDTTDESAASAIKILAIEMLGPTAERTGRAPKTLLLYRTSEEVGYSSIRFRTDTEALALVELLPEGKQFVAHGIHPMTGQPYHWPAGILPLADLPYIEPAQLEAFFAQLAATLPAAERASMSSADRTRVSQRSLRGHERSVRAAMKVLPNRTEFFPTRNDYLRVGYAVKAALPDDEAAAFEIFSEWTERWEDPPQRADGTSGGNDPDEVAEDWRRMKPPFGVGATWIYEQAEKLSAGRFRQIDEWFEPIDDAPSVFDVRPDVGPPVKRKKLARVSLADAAAGALSDAAQPLIKGLLDQGAMSVLYGESNVGKTFVALDMAVHVALGRPWAGMKTTKMPVLYVAAEGGRGARKRAAALMRRIGPDAHVALFDFVLSPVDLLRDDADLSPLIEASREVSAGLIVIDTLSRALAGGDENSSVDMGRLVRHFDAIRAAGGAHVLVVHHSGKDKARGARGHSLLRAATDTEIEIMDGQIRATKQRDLDRNFASSFELEAVQLGLDGDGDPISSCTVRLTQSISPIAGKPTPKEQAVLDALRVLSETAGPGQREVPVTELESYLSKDAGPDMKADAIRFHLRSLGKKNLARTPRRGRWSPIAQLDDHFQVEDTEGPNGGSVFD